MNSITNPDSINQSLLSYLSNQEELVSNYKRTFTYAASYEDFVEMILKCEDIEELKQIRFVIQYRNQTFTVSPMINSLYSNSANVSKSSSV